MNNTFSVRYVVVPIMIGLILVKPHNQDDLPEYVLSYDSVYHVSPVFVSGNERNNK